MIQANELRVGSWVDYFGNYGQVETIKKDGVVFLVYGKLKQGNFGNVIEALEPIPLKPEMLQQFGFTSGRQTNIDGLIQYDFWQTQNLGGKTHRYILHKEGEYIFYKGYNIVGRSFIKYVHDFQNWYFSVYREELQYNPCK